MWLFIISNNRDTRAIILGITNPDNSTMLFRDIGPKARSWNHTVQLNVYP